MTCRVQSEVAGDVLTRRPASTLVMSVLGVMLAAQDILESIAVPAAISAGEAAIARNESLRSADRAGTNGVHEAGGDGVTVTRRQCAGSFVDTMARTRAAGEAIVWGV